MHRDHQENKCDDQENNETRHIFVVKIFLLGNFCRLRRWCGSDLTTLTQCLNQDIDFHGESLSFVVHAVLYFQVKCILEGYCSEMRLKIRWLT